MNFNKLLTILAATAGLAVGAVAHAKEMLLGLIVHASH